MNSLSRKIAVVLSACALAMIALVVSTSGAQASRDLAPAGVPVTMNIRNATGHPIEVTVMPDGGTPVRKILDTGETWKVTAAYGRMNELSMRIPGNPNYQFLGHFDYASGQFHMFEVVHSSVPFYMQPKGAAAGISFMP